MCGRRGAKAVRGGARKTVRRCLSGPGRIAAAMDTRDFYLGGTARRIGTIPARVRLHHTTTTTTTIQRAGALTRFLENNPPRSRGRGRKKFKKKRKEKNPETAASDGIPRCRVHVRSVCVQGDSGARTRCTDRWRDGEKELTSILDARRVLVHLHLKFYLT